MSENNENENVIIDWKLGTPEVAFLSVFFAVVFGLPFLLSRTEFLLIAPVIFYIFLFIIGFFGHIDDVTEEGFKRISAKGLWLGIGLGLIGFIVIQIMFFLRITLLATQEGTLTMNKWELLIFNLTFVIAAEELVFRDTLPFILTQVFKRFMNENLAIAISFVLSSISFGLLHIWTYGFDLLAVVKAIVSGIILSIIRIFGGLLASYLAHMVYNSLNIAGLFILPGMI